jgi:hypothetical protein
MTTRSLLIVVLLAGGCAGADYVYTKAGATAEQKETDKTDCLVDARTTVQGPGGGPQMQVNQDRYRRCMADKGYTLEKVAR